MRNPWKLILQNAKGAQLGWNTSHSKKGIKRKVKSFSITENDIRNVFYQQSGRSRWLNIPLNPEDVFRKHYPFSPSLDRIDNSKDYTPENICLSTRFENYGFNTCSDETKQECIEFLKKSLEFIANSEFITTNEPIKKHTLEGFLS
jgi:hypothetical protein